MLYKDNEEQVLERLNRLYTGSGHDRIYARMNIPSPTLLSYAEKYSDGETKYPPTDERIEFWDSYLKEFKTLEDDSLPLAYLSEFDEGLYGGLLGAETRFLRDTGTGWISSMAIPFINDLSEIRSLDMAASSKWHKSA